MRGTVARELRRLTGFDPNAARTKVVMMIPKRRIDRWLPGPLRRWVLRRRKRVPATVPTAQAFRRKIYRQFKRERTRHG